MLPCELSMVAEAARHDASIAVSLRLVRARVRVDFLSLDMFGAKGKPTKVQKERVGSLSFSPGSVIGKPHSRVIADAESFQALIAKLCHQNAGLDAFFRDRNARPVGFALARALVARRGRV
jgi:hypothetical protein